MMVKHDPAVVAKWRNLIAQQAESQLTVEAFCRKKKIQQSGFYHWKAVLAKLDANAMSPTQAKQSIPSKPKAKCRPKSNDTSLSATFVPVQIVADTPVEVTLPNGIHIRLPLATNPQQLAQLIQAVASC